MHRHPVDGFHLHRGSLDVELNVGDGERRKHGHVLGSLLLLLEVGSGCYKSFGVLRGESSLGVLEPVRLLFVELVLVLRVGRHNHSDAVHVVEQLLLNQLLEVGALGERLPEGGHVLVDLQRTDGVALVAPGRHGTHSQVQAEAGADMALAELHLVSESLEAVLLKASLSCFLERVEHNLLDLVHVVGRDVLQSNAESGLGGRRVVPSARSVARANPRVDQRLVHWSVRPVHQQRRHQGEVKSTLLVVASATTQPGHRDLGLLFRIWGHGILRAGGDHADRLEDSRFILDVSGRVGRRKFAERLLFDHLEMVLKREVPVRIKPGVTRMVVRTVELFQLVIGEIGDIGRLPPAVVRIGVVGEQGLLQSCAKQIRWI
mmetsp:Transcript_2656/g.6328  ORF Transcript_2656/g.6328 Transcript_2656/m.6328 type:complete len:375 (-) Transcript_2656:622-1746(-)